MNSFVLDAFQKKAIACVNKGHSVIVAAPTGAGKTVIAEHVIRTCLKRGEKVIYTSPIKALSNQKYREFQDETENRAGILTGDISLNPSASVLIMTTEVFRNKILEHDRSLQNYSWIIFDEIHYLDDAERGTVWEESLIFLPEHMKMLGLSATIPNINELKKWLETIHNKPIKIVKETKRPVPLHVFFQCQNRMYDDIKKVIKYGFNAPGVHLNLNQKMSRHINIKPNKPKALVSDLFDQDLLPCIYFVFSRRRTEILAEEMVEFNFLNNEEKQNIRQVYKDLCKRFDVAHEARAYDMLPLIERGIAYHHAGMLPTLKEVIERLFTSRLLKVIFTTETFALGINMPARSVIFDELSKYYGRAAYSCLRTRDFYQMAGRAGRRSIDTEGFVFCRINPHFISAAELQSVVYSKPEKVCSQFNVSYATILNLYQSFREKLYDIYPKSFHYFQAGRFHRKRAVANMRAKVEVLKELEYIRHGKLTQKGVFASKVYGYEMMLAELYSEGILEELSVKQLGILIMAVVYEPRKGQIKPKLNKQAKGLESASRKMMRRIHRIEKSHKMKDLTKRCYFHLTPVIEAWIRQEDFNSILTYTEADEGEVIRYLRMSIQLLREIMDGPVIPELKRNIQKLIGLINRDVVDSEKQLRA